MSEIPEKAEKWDEFLNDPSTIGQLPEIGFAGTASCFTPVEPVT